MEIKQGQNKSLADVVNLKGIIETVLKDYSGKDLSNEFVRFEIADRIYERYKKLVKEISVKFLEYESTKRSTIQTFQSIVEQGKQFNK